MVLTAEQHHPNIKIFVSAHKQATFPEGNSIVPVQVGAANAATRFTNTLHDDEGVNISAENPRYCELTAQYWAGKTRMLTITLLPLPQVLRFHRYSAQRERLWRDYRFVYR